MFFEDLAVINENLYQTSNNVPGVYLDVVEESKDQLSVLKFGDGESSSSNSDLGSPAAIIEKNQAKLTLKRESNRDVAYNSNYKSPMNRSITKRAIIPRNRYFIKKGFCILSKKIAASADLNKINVFLRNVALNGNMYAHFEDYIARLLFQIPMPMPHTKMKLYLPSQNPVPDNQQTISQEDVIQIYQPLLDGFLPYIDPRCISTLFSSLTFENILLLLRRVLLDTSNLFISKDSGKIIDCCEAIKSLIYPYKYELVYIPYLPEILLDRVDAPFIFMLGVEDKFTKKVEDYIKDGTYMINLDTDKICQIPHTSVTLLRTGSNKAVASEDLPDLPFSSVKKLKKAIQSIAVKVKAQVMNPEQVNDVRRAFFNFFMEPLKEFTRYIIKQKQSLPKTDFDSIFHLKGFIQNFEMTLTDQEVRFYKLFTSMTLFTRLVERAALQLTKED